MVEKVRPITAALSATAAAAAQRPGSRIGRLLVDRATLPATLGPPSTGILLVVNDAVPHGARVSAHRSPLAPAPRAPRGPLSSPLPTGRPPRSAQHRHHHAAARRSDAISHNTTETAPSDRIAARHRRRWMTTRARRCRSRPDGPLPRLSPNSRLRPPTRAYAIRDSAPSRLGPASARKARAGQPYRAGTSRFGLRGSDWTCG